MYDILLQKQNVKKKVVTIVCYRESKLTITSKETTFISASKPVTVTSLYILGSLPPKVVRKILTIYPDIFTCCHASVYHYIIYRKEFSHIVILLYTVLPFVKKKKNYVEININFERSYLYNIFHCITKEEET